MSILPIRETRLTTQHHTPQRLFVPCQFGGQLVWMHRLHGPSSRCGSQIGPHNPGWSHFQNFAPDWASSGYANLTTFGGRGATAGVVLGNKMGDVV